MTEMAAIINCRLSNSLDHRMWKALLAVIVLWASWSTAHAQGNPAAKQAQASRVPQEQTQQEEFLRERRSAIQAVEPAAVVVQKAKEMTDEKAYAFLLKWVVPEANQTGFQMQFDVMPYSEQRALPPERVEIDRFLSPAIQLISVAKRLNKLDDLLLHINAADASKPQDVRAKSSLLTLVYANQNKVSLAKAEIEKLLELAEKPLPRNTSLVDRAPEFYVILHAGRKPELYFDTHGLATSLRLHERNMSTIASDTSWGWMINNAISSLNRWSQGDVVPEPLKQWTSVPYLTAQQSARGLRPTVWRMEKKLLKHDGGEVWSSLYFQSPLRGKFEITANRSTFNYGEMLISVGMHSAEPLWDLKGHRVHRALLGSIAIDGPITLPAWEAMADFKIVVDSNTVKTFTNGVLIHEEQFSAPIDPWISMQAEWPGFSTTVKSLEIHGTPEIPREIDLVNVADAGGWRVGFYEYSTYPNPVGRYYRFTSGEIQGIKPRDAFGFRTRESFLQYSRPMLEDGEFEYEFYYEPGKFETHPVLGKNAVILNGEVAVVHPLSNFPFERSEITPDTVQQIAGAVTPNLKASNWNHVLMKLKGDQLALSVNGEQVAARTVNEPRNERFFGFLRFINQSEMRVRNAKYRGDWPKELPPVSQQELADKSEL